MPTNAASGVFAILVFAAVLTACQGVFGLVTVAKQKRTVNRRLRVADRIEGGLSSLVIELRKQRGLTADGDRRGLRWLSELVVQSGVPYDRKTWAMGVGGAALVGAFGGLVLGHGLIAALIGLLVCGLWGPILFLKIMAGRRAKALGAQLPQALEIIVRSLEAGHPVPTAIALVGREMPDPIGSEFGMAGDEIAYGATLEQAVERMSGRCRHPDVDLFAATVRLQERSGGNLTGLLKLNAATVRERHKMRLKIRAASSEGRASALILTLTPFIVGGFMQISSPDFYGEVIHMSFVRYALMALGVWMFIGNLIIRKMIDMRI